MSAKPDDRRRHPRRATKQAARLEFAGITLPCEIRDYCQAGLQLVFPPGEIGHTVLPLERGAPLGIDFVAGSGAVRRRFQLQGRAAHITSTSIGVFLESISDEAMQALAQASPAGVRPDDLSGIALGDGKRRALRQECTRQFSSFLDRLLQDFFAKAPGKLNDAGLDAGSLSQSRYLLGAIELEQHRGSIQEAFFTAIRERLQQKPTANGNGVNRPTPDLTADELELVDADKFEDWLNMAAVIHRVEAELDVPLADFEKRYALLIDSPVDRKVNPFGPEVICSTLHGALDRLDFTNPMRAVLYQAFGQALDEHLPELYARLGKILALIQPSGSSRTVVKRSGKVAHSPAAGEETLVAGTAPAANAEADEYSLDRILATLDRGPDPGPSKGRAAYSELANLSLTRLTEALRQSSTELAHEARPLAAPAIPGQPEASLQELLAAVESLSMGQLTVPGGPEQDVSAQLRAQLALAAGGARSISPAYQQSLDLATSLYGRARAEHDPASEVEALLRRLERPLLKLALQDPGFLSATEHPARSVVNLIDRFTIATDDQGKFFDPKLQHFLSLLVDRICNQSGADPGVFVAVAERLEKVLAPIRQARRNRIFRLQEASEAREALRGARARVTAFLRDRLAGREVPALLVQLLDAGWRQYLTLLAMRRAADSGEWDAAAKVLDEIEACLSPGGNAAVNHCLVFDEAHRRLASVNIETTEVEHLVGEMAAQLLNVDAAPRVVVPAEAYAQADEEVATMEVPEPLWSSQLAVGDWWPFSESGRWVPRQLIWRNATGSAWAFTNRSATTKVELNQADLAQRHVAGAALPDPNQALPLLERSENALFDDTFRKLVDQVMHDPLTGLLNRKGFVRRLSDVTAGAAPEQRHALCLLEFDQIRVVYSSSGADAGDKLLRKLIALAQAELPEGAVLGAINNDAYVLYLPGHETEAGRLMAEKLLDKLKDHRFQHERQIYSIGLNIGLTEFRPAVTDLEEAIRQADSACLAAKSQGRNRLQVYAATDAQLKAEESLQSWASRIDSILEHDGLFLRCQLVQPLGDDSESLPYYEILLGIHDIDEESVEPMHFILAVERWKRSHEVDLWVLRTVFAWIRAHRDRFERTGGFAINLSALSLNTPEVLAYLHQELGRNDLPAQRLAFEVTETTTIDCYHTAQDFIRQVRAYGCRFSLDDFGSGFASYAHLKNLRTDTLKIDGSFVKEIGQSEMDFAMVKSMNDISHSLGMKTVAEYVESDLILSRLRQIGVDYAQGYAIHKPIPLDHLLQG